MSNKDDFNVHVSPTKDPEMHELLTRMRANGGFSNFILQCVKKAYPEIAKDGIVELNENITLLELANKQQNKSIDECFEIYEKQLKMHDGRNFDEMKLVENLAKKLSMKPKTLHSELKKRHKERMENETEKKR